MKRIAIVEDEAFMREELALMLEKAGYEVCLIQDFSRVEQELLQIAPHLVLLDLNLPGSSGFDICRNLKAKKQYPILVLTSRTQMQDELHALALGADEFLTKPCHKDRLLARIQNLLKRFDGFLGMLEGGGFYLDPNTYTIYKNQESGLLPEKEGKILGILIKAKGEMVPREQLFWEVWGTQEYVDENILQVNMTRLRKSLRRFGLEGRIKTIRGRGYMLECEAENLQKTSTEGRPL